MAYTIIIGHIGSDAGYTVIGSDGKVHHVGGWGPEALAEVRAATAVLQAATSFKAPGMTERTVESVLDYVQSEIGKNLGDRLPDGSAVLIL